MTTWLDDILPPRVFEAGVEVLPNVRELNLGSGLTAIYNTATKQIDIELDVAAAGFVEKAADSVATEVPTFAGTGGAELTRGPLKHVDVAGVALITPRTAAAAMCVGSTSGDVCFEPGPTPNAGVTVLNRGSRASFSSMRGGKRTVAIGGAETEPSGGAVTDHVQLWSASGVLKAFGAYDAAGVDVVAHKPGAVTDGAVLAFDGTSGSLVKAASGVGDVTGAGAGAASSIPMVDSTGKVLSRSGATADGSGHITGSSFTGDVTGNLTGDVLGDVTGDVTGNVTGYLTGVAYRALTIVGSVSGVDLKATGTTDMYTVPTGCVFVAHDLLVEPETVVGYVTGPTIAVGANSSSYDDAFRGATGGHVVSAENVGYSVSMRETLIADPIPPDGKTYTAGQVVKAKVVTAATGTTIVGRLSLAGFLRRI